MTTETIAAIGIVLFCAFIAWAVRTACKWGDQTRQREAEFERQARFVTPDEHGEEITIIREEHDTGAQGAGGDRTDR